MRAIPTLIRPRLLSIKNRWRVGGKERMKEILSVAVSFGLMCALYTSALHAFRDSAKEISQANIDPLIPLTMILSTLFIMLLLSSAVTALGSLFIAKDLDLLLSSPVTWSRFFWGRSLDVGISSSWMLLVFATPLLLAFGTFHGATATFYLLSPVIFSLFFALAVLLGIITALVFGSIVPPRRGREAALVIFLVGILGSLFMFGDSNPTSGGAFPHHYAEELKFISSFARNPWSPITYSSESLYHLTRGDLVGALRGIAVILVAVLSLWCITLRISASCYQAAYSRAHSGGGAFRINSRSAQRFTRLLMPVVEPPRRALISKEIKLFSRDVAHTIQLGMLLGICFVYLYNFKVLTGPKDASATALKLWQITLLVCNISLSYLIVTSICSRFVFPSISLEGGAFWILQSSPISLPEILQAKCRCWLIPVTIMGVVIFASGAMALRAEPPLLLATCAAAIILCYGLVTLGVGMGAIFHQFEWDHATQLSSNVGSFIYMVVSMLFLALNMIPIIMMFGAYVMMPELTSSARDTAILFGLSLTILFALNRLIARWALSAGVKALAER